MDPSGQYRAAGQGATVRESGVATNHLMARVVAHRGTPGKGSGGSAGCGGCKQVQPKVSPPPTRYDSYGCQVGDQECDAQQMGDDDAAVWAIMGAVLGLMSVALFAYGTSLPIVGTAFVAAGGVFATAGAIAVVIGVLFNREAAHDPAWFDVRANLTTFDSQVATMLVALTALTAVISTFLLAIPPVAAVAGTIKLLSLALGIGFSALFRSEMNAQEQKLGYL